MWLKRYRPDGTERFNHIHLVTSFEVAEHLPVEDADKFVAVVVAKSPRHVFFGAATPFQDRGGRLRRGAHRARPPPALGDARGAAGPPQELVVPQEHPRPGPREPRPELDAAVAKHPDAAD